MTELTDDPGQVDLRSDAVTRPTDEMWSAMRAARLGWPRAADRDVAALEEQAAALMGKEAALFVPTGTMANTLALMSWMAPGEAFIADERAHVLTSEGQAFARIVGVWPRTLVGERGHLRARQVEELLAETPMGHDVPTSLLWLEETHTFAGGTTSDPACTADVARAARAASLAVHVDGARIFNAALARSMTVGEVAAPADSVTVNLNKGLSAPGGAVLCGQVDFIERAAQHLVRLGGGLSQPGLIAAAGRIALGEPMVRRLEDDHAVARALAAELAGLDPLEVHPPETNIVIAGLPSGLRAEEFREDLASGGILVMTRDVSSLRLVTHRHIGTGAVGRVTQVVERALVSRGL